MTLTILPNIFTKRQIAIDKTAWSLYNDVIRLDSYHS